MKRHSKLKIWALATAGSAFFMTACNNSDYTRNPANESESTSVKTDTTMGNTTMKDSSSAVAANKPATSNTKIAGKKARVSVGKMAERKTSSMKPDKDGVYEITDVRPAYPGGQSALEDYVNNNVDYDQAAIDNTTEGTVDVQFVVDENGNVANAKVVGKKLGNGLDDEAVKVISSMPKWTPGKVKGKNVKTRMVLPITFKIEQ